MKSRMSLIVFALFTLSIGATAQVELPDGFTVWTTDWDSNNPGTGYYINEWKYLEADGFWELVEHVMQEPLILGQEYAGNIYDMGMDMIQLAGSTEMSAILTVSMGDGHFPSTGTEFQHRKLNADGEWEAAQDPLFTTPADVSPLGVDIYTTGGEVHIVWVEDNDAAGPHSNMCDIFDQGYSIQADGTLSPVGEPVLVFSRALLWGGTHPGNGGITGLGACDYDGDGDQDFLIGEMYYGDSPASAAIHLIEQTGPGVWSDTLQEVFFSVPGRGSEAVTCCDIDGDDDLDVAKTTGDGDGAWNQVYWYEKQGDTLEARGLLIDCGFEGEPFQIGVGHIFGLYINESQEITDVSGWMLR